MAAYGLEEHDPSPAGSARCALCGHQPGPDDAEALRVLGAAPLTVTVCRDRHACVARFHDRNRAGT